LATLMDTAGMAAAWCTPEPPASLRGATATLTVTYLAPATGRVLAEAAVLRRGRRLVTLDVVAGCGDRDVARALATYALG
jgi:acyl-coenzyme A thioesterase PaaI-like protein